MNELEKTVLEVFDHSLPIGDGYAHRSREIIRFLRELGWKTVHVTSGKQGNCDASVESVDGLDFYRTNQPNNLINRLPVLNQIGIVKALRKRLMEVVQDVRPAVIHVHSPCLNALAAIPIAKQLSVPVIYEIRALWEDGAVDSGVAKHGDLRYRMSRFLETRVARQVDHIVTICEGLRLKMLNRGVCADRITVAPNSVNLDRLGAVKAGDTAPLKGFCPRENFRVRGFFLSFRGA